MPGSSRQKGALMKNLKNVFVTMTLAAVLTFGMSVPVYAGDSRPWRINYIPTAPTSVSNQTTSVSLPYYSNGYYAYCDFFAGENGSRIAITSYSTGGMPTIVITSTGRSATWKMYGASTSGVVFTLRAVSGFPCNASGSINTN